MKSAQRRAWLMKNPRGRTLGEIVKQRELALNLEQHKKKNQPKIKGKKVRCKCCRKRLYLPWREEGYMCRSCEEEYVTPKYWTVNLDWKPRPPEILPWE